MSYTTSPLGALFDVQRRAIEQTHAAVTRSIELQQEASAPLTDVDRIKQVNDQSFDLVHSVVDGYFEALESAFPGQEERIEDLRARVDDQVAAIEDLQDEAIETLDANTADRRVVAEDASDEFLALVDETVDAVLEFHEAFEAETLDATEDLEDSLGDQLERFEAQLDDLRERLSTLTAEDREPRSRAVSVEIESEAEELEAIKGIGPAYAERLRAHGIKTFADLAAASTETVATAADVTEGRADSWIEAAKATV